MRLYLCGLLMAAAGLYGQTASADGNATTNPVEVPSLTLPARDWAALKALSPKGVVQWQPGSSGEVAKLATGLEVPTVGATSEARARHFLQAWGSVFGLSGVELELAEASEMRGLSVVQFRLVYNTLPVYGRSLTVTLDAEGQVRTVSSDAVLFGNLQLGGLQERDARALAVKAVYQDALPAGAEPPTGARMVALSDGLQTVAAWHVQVPALPLLTPVDVLIDSRDGRVLLVRDVVVH